MRGVIFFGRPLSRRRQLPLSEEIDNPLGRPAECGAQFHAVEGRLLPRGSGSSVDHAAIGFDAMDDGLHCSSNLRERRTYRRNCPGLSFPEGLQNVRIAPNVEMAVARADSLGFHRCPRLPMGGIYW